MTNTKEQPKRQIKVREPKKAQPDTFANLRPLPQAHPIEEIMGLTTTTPHHSPPVTTTQQQSPPLTSQPLAPTRDFNKRANSLERDALPEGLFTGSSKKIYDALYLRTRGAVVPRKRVRASRKDLLEWTGIKNLKTIDAQLRLLMAVGLVVRHWERGQIEGSEYEVLLPEEAQSLTTTPHDSPAATTSQNLSGGYTQTLGTGGNSQTIESTAASGTDQTSSKTSVKTDDEDLTRFDEIIRKRARMLIGRTVKGEGERWARLANVIMDIVERAAGRTEQVSSVPAFTTAVLLSLSAANERRARRAIPAQIEQPSDEAPQPLSEELLQEQIAVLKELVASGYPPAQIDHQFGRAFSPEEWERIRMELNIDQCKDEVGNGDEQQIS